MKRSTESIDRLASSRYVTCTVCGKRGYFERKTAKIVRQQMGQPSGGLHVYQCVGGVFHLGHMRPDTMRAWYEQRRARVLNNLILQALPEDRDPHDLVIVVHSRSQQWLLTKIGDDTDLRALPVHTNDHLPAYTVFAVRASAVIRVTPEETHA